MPFDLRRYSLSNAVNRQYRYKQNARDDSGAKQLVDRYFRNRTVQNDRQARREKQPEAPGCRHQAEHELFAVFFGNQYRKDEAAERNDGDSRSPGERREHCTACKNDDRQSSRHPSDERLRQCNNALRRFALCKKISRNGKQGNGKQDGLAGKAVHFDNDSRSIDTLRRKSQQRYRADDREERRTEENKNRQSKDKIDDGHQCCSSMCQSPLMISAAHATERTRNRNAIMA